MCRRISSSFGCGWNPSAFCIRCFASFMPNATWCLKSAGCGPNRRRWANSPKQFNAMFWESAPYQLAGGGLALGHPGDLQGAGGRFLRHLLCAAKYHADPGWRFQARRSRRRWRRNISTRIPARPKDAPDVVTLEVQTNWRRNACTPKPKPTPKWISLAHGPVSAQGFLCAGDSGADSFDPHRPAL